ncbi:MAG: T9SS type A sorting domain-containing protein [Candidatus Azobacteroides sp.]|nr:T9SS type A sorting domain-containing protein [Candidatus Azobacteroides sp.]
MAWMCGSTMNAVNIPAGTELYLKVNDNWKSANARFAAYFFNDAVSPVAEMWVDFTAVSGETDLYKVVTPAGTWPNVIFCRMNSGTTENNWDNKWNQSSNLTYDGTADLITILDGVWDGTGDNCWTTYIPPTPLEPLGPITIRLCNPSVLWTCAGDNGEGGIGLANDWDPLKDGQGDVDVWFYYWYNSTTNGQLKTGKVKPDVIYVGNIPCYQYIFDAADGFGDIAGSLNLLFLRRLDLDDPSGIGFPVQTPTDYNGYYAGDQTINVEDITESHYWIIQCMSAGGEGYRGVQEMTEEQVEEVFTPTGLPQTLISAYTVTSGSGIIQAQFEGTAAVELYTVSGVLLKKTAAVGSFEQTGLAPGLYIVKINGKADKVAVK